MCPATQFQTRAPYNLHSTTPRPTSSTLSERSIKIFHSGVVLVGTSSFYFLHFRKAIHGFLLHGLNNVSAQTCTSVFLRQTHFNIIGYVGSSLAYSRPTGNGIVLAH